MYKFRMLCVAVVGLTSLVGRCALGTVIVADTFTTPALSDGDSIEGRAPETNLPGTSWAKTNSFVGFNATTGRGKPAPGVNGLEGQVSDCLSIASSGSYTKPTVFTISADVSVCHTGGYAADGRGVGLGFYSATGGTFSQNLFTGLLLDSSGNLNLVQDPNASGFYDSGSHIGTPVAYVGSTFDQWSMYHLSYQVDTSTGRISGISLQGSTADYSSLTSTTLFTDAATKYAGVFDSSNTGGAIETGAFDNFQVSTTTTPEPSSIVLVATSLIGLLCYAWRGRK